MSEYEITKHIAAIHISNRLSLLERKISNVLLKNAWVGLVDKEVHRIKIQEIADAVGFDSKDINQLKEALRALRNIEIQWNICGQDKRNRWGVSGILASAEINDKSGICEYSYPVHLRELLKSPNIFARLNLLIQRQFDSKYSLALWEYASGQIALSGDSEDIAVTPWLALDTLHELLGAVDTEYTKEFKAFNRDVLKPAIYDVNRHSDVEIKNTESIRENRKITALRFIISQKDVYQLPLGIEMPEIGVRRNISMNKATMSAEKSALLTRLVENGIEEKFARGLVNGFSIDRITENLDWAIRQIESGRQIERPSGFITTAIRRDFVAPQRVKRKKLDDVKTKQEAKQDLDAYVQKINGDFWLHRIDSVKGKTAVLSEKEQKNFEQALLDANVFITPKRWEQYRSEGITDKKENSAIRGLYYAFAFKYFLTDEQRDIVSFARSQGANDAVIRELMSQSH